MLLRRSALRLHDRGEDVVRLQRALSELGYDVGECDGEFGYVTQDALMQFQREHRLRVDGVAGPQVRAMLFHPELQSTRTVHIVKKDETLTDIARRYGVTVEYLQRSNRLSRRRRLYEGQRLVVRCRTVLGFTERLTNARGIDFVLRRTAQTLTGLSAVHFRMDDSGEWVRTAEPEVLDVCRNRGTGMFAYVHTRGEGGQTAEAFGAFLAAKKRWKPFYDELNEIVRIPDVFAVCVDVGPIRFGDGARFLRWIAGATEIVRAAGLKLYVGIPVFRPGLRGRLGAAELDVRRLARHAHGLILQGHWFTTWGDPLPSLSTLQYNLRRLCRQVPSWKVILGMSLDAYEYDEASRTVRTLSYQQGMALAYTQRQKPAWDDDRAVLSCAWSDADTGAMKELWIAGSGSVEAKIHLVERCRLGGIFLGPLGGEDIRIWQRLPRFLTACRHDRGGMDIRIGMNR